MCDGTGDGADMRFAWMMHGQTRLDRAEGTQLRRTAVPLIKVEA